MFDENGRCRSCGTHEVLHAERCYALGETAEHGVVASITIIMPSVEYLLRPKAESPP